jgi:hypothetical protein
VLNVGALQTGVFLVLLALFLPNPVQVVGLLDNPPAGDHANAQRRYKREDVQYIRNHLHAGKRRRPAKQISGKDFHWL